MSPKHFANYLEYQIVDIKNLQTSHEDVQDIAKIACVAWKLSPSKFQTLNGARLWDITMHSPILCVDIRSKMYVIGGFRTWNIVMAYHQKNDSPANVPVQIIKRKMNKNQRREVAASSLLLSLISQSLGMHASKHIGDIWTSIETLAPDLYEHFFKRRSSTKSRLPKELGQSYASFYSKGKSQ